MQFPAGSKVAVEMEVSKARANLAIRIPAPSPSSAHLRWPAASLGGAEGGGGSWWERPFYEIKQAPAGGRSAAWSCLGRRWSSRVTRNGLQ